MTQIHADGEKDGWTVQELQRPCLARRSRVGLQLVAGIVDAGFSDFFRKSYENRSKANALPVEQSLYRIFKPDSSGATKAQKFAATRSLAARNESVSRDEWDKFYETQVNA